MLINFTGGLDLMLPSDSTLHTFHGDREIQFLGKLSQRGDHDEEGSYAEANQEGRVKWYRLKQALKAAISNCPLRVRCSSSLVVRSICKNSQFHFNKVVIC